MKKQILFLAMFTLALIVSTTATFGQIVGPAPRVIDCVSATLDPLKPVPGTEYTYEVDVPTPAGTKTYNWFVTQDKNFIVNKVLTTTGIDPGDGNGTFIAGVNTTAAGASTYHLAGTTTDKIFITWKAFDPTTPTFLVIYVTNADAAGTGCTIDNLKAYLIEPINAFTLDIANVDTIPAIPVALAYGTDNKSCMPNIISATYNTTDKKVEYDFGVTRIYYYIAAANFNTSYDLNFQLKNVDAWGTVKIDWTYNLAVPVWTNLTLGGSAAAATGYTAKATVNAQSTTKAVGATGESILVRVTLDHTTSPAVFFEGLTAQAVTLEIDGQTGPDAASDGVRDVPDIHTTGVGSPAVCSADGFDNDKAIHNVNPRPDVQPVAPTMIPIEGK